jgi:hypothetical protein
MHDEYGRIWAGAKGISLVLSLQMFILLPDVKLIGPKWCLILQLPKRLAWCLACIRLAIVYYHHGGKFI